MLASGVRLSSVLVVCGLLHGACQRTEAAPDRSAPTPASASAPISQPSRPSDASGAAEAPARACQVACAVARELGCARAADCAATCVEMWNAPACREPVRAALECFAAEPASRWECDEEGQAAIRDGYCDREQQAAARCLEQVGP